MISASETRVYAVGLDLNGALSLLRFSIHDHNYLFVDLLVPSAKLESLAKQLVALNLFAVSKLYIA